MYHAEAALRVWNFLAAESADSLAHPVIDDLSQTRHRRNIVHSVAENEFWFIGRKCSRNESVDLFRPMLSVGVEDDYEIDLSLQPMAQSSLDRLAFAAVLRMNDDFRAGFARALRRFISRAIIDNQNVVELLARSANHVPNMLFFVVSGNDRRGFGFVH